MDSGASFSDCAFLQSCFAQVGNLFDLVILLVSGQAPRDPVVSPATGLVYERSLILKHLATSATCPVTGMELHEADLIQLKPTSASLPITPRPPQLASVPSLLNAFQNEWDATMLDLMSVKGKYLETRQELSHALYREDAAKRVIARLMRERDEAREALGALKATVGVQQQETAVAMEGVEGHASFDQVITNTFNEMSKNRKQRRVPPLPRETLAHMNLQHALPGLHSATHPGVTALDVLGDQVATGGHDKLVHVYGLDGKLIASGKGHTKKVTSVAWIIDGVIVSASADKNARLWKATGKTLKSAHIWKEASPLVAISMHPSRKFVVAVQEKATWSVYNVESFETVFTAQDDQDVPYTCGKFHPDGVILAIGTGVSNAETGNGMVRIWDTRTRQVAATFANEVQGAGGIVALAFSENGYHLAIGDTSGVSVWDLRKSVSIKRIDVPAIAALAWDASGTYLVGGGKDVRVWEGGKNGAWEQLACWEDNVDTITSVQVTKTEQPDGTYALRVLASGMDRCLRIYG